MRIGVSFEMDEVMSQDNGCGWFAGI